MTYNEAETRYYLIDPVQREKGYDAHQWLKLETPAPVEATDAKGLSSKRQWPCRFGRRCFPN